MPNYAPYGAARTALLQAQARVAETPANEQALAALAAAYVRLNEEEEPIRVEINQAWDNNIVSLADANQTFTEARQALAALEIETGNAARQRDPVHPIVNAEELAALETANAAVEDARTAVNDAKTTFKAGVTVEQLEAL